MPSGEGLPLWSVERIVPILFGILGSLLLVVFIHFGLRPKPEHSGIIPFLAAGIVLSLVADVFARKIRTHPFLSFVFFLVLTVYCGLRVRLAPGWLGALISLVAPCMLCTTLAYALTKPLRHLGRNAIFVSRIVVTAILFGAFAVLILKPSGTSRLLATIALAAVSTLLNCICVILVVEISNLLGRVEAEA